MTGEGVSQGGWLADLIDDPSIAMIIDPELREGGEITCPGFVKIVVVGYSDVMIGTDIIADRAPAVSRAQHVFDLWKQRKAQDVVDGEAPITSQVVHRVGEMIHRRLG